MVCSEICWDWIDIWNSIQRSSRSPQVLTQSRHTWPTNTKIWLILSHKKRSIANPGSNHDPVNLPAIWSIAPALFMLLDVYLIRQRLGRIKRHCFSLTRYSWVRMGDKSLRKRQSEEKDSGKE